MGKIKLLVVSHSCLEPTNRAVYRYLATQHGIQIHLVVPEFNDVGDGFRKCPEVENEPFPVTILRPVGRHLRFRRLSGLPALIQKEKPTHIYVEADPSTWLVSEVIWLARNSETSVWALTGENLERNYAKEALVYFLKGNLKSGVGCLTAWLFLQVAKRGISKVFTVSRDGTRVMEALGFKDRAIQIPLGFDPKIFFPQRTEQIQKTRASLHLNRKTIAYFGRLSHEKGIHILLQALGQMKDLSWQLLLDDFTHEQSPYVKKIKSMLLELGIHDRVVFFQASHEQMPQFMNAVDISVLPSVSNPKWKEQYGRVVPEAMACGKIVVGSNSGAIPEIIGENGFVFPEGDANSLSQLLRKLILVPEEEFHQRGVKAAQTASRDFSLIRQAEIWLGILAVTSQSPEPTESR